jgi:hypothetical protein
MRTKHAESLSVAGDRADGEGCRAITIVANLGLGRNEMDERGRHVRVAKLSQAFAGGMTDGDRGQAFLGIAAVLFQVLDNEAIEQRALLVVNVTASEQVVGHRPILVASRDAKGCHELVLVNQAVLKSK